MNINKKNDKKRKKKKLEIGKFLQSSLTATSYDPNTPSIRN